MYSFIKLSLRSFLSSVNSWYKPCRNISSGNQYSNYDLENSKIDHLRDVLTYTDRNLASRISCSERLVSARQAWVETLRSSDPQNAYLDSPLGIVSLHPDVFAVFPRLDLVHKNLYWQAHYRLVDWRCITTRAELLHRSRRKPWPQKGTGRARHGNRRTHIWIGGGQCKGPRGPESFFSILPYSVRVAGLLSMLTIKQAQGDLHIVEDLSLCKELEDEARSVYDLANCRALEKLQAQNVSDEMIDSTARILSEKLAVTEAEMLPPSTSTDEPALLSAIRRDKEDNEEFLSLVKGGKAVQAARIAYNSAVYLRKLVDSRSWGPSVLFVTEEETFLGRKPLSEEASNGLSMALACASYSQYIDMEVAPEASLNPPPINSPFAAPRALHPGRGLTLMPLHGLNVWSMVNHDTLVLTRNCLDLLEDRLLHAQKRISLRSSRKLYEPPLADDWIVDEDGYGLELDDVEPELRQNRHFAEALGDVEELKKRLQ